MVKPPASFREKMSLMPGWTAAVTINAPQQSVWDRVTDFAAYEDWNPFVIEAEANFQVGSKIRFKEDLHQFGQHWLTARFLSINAPHSFVWQGYFGAPFLFRVRHTFSFEAMGDRQTRFAQKHENFGLLIPYLAWRGIYLVSHQGYIDFNQALKQQCEQ